jgi:hypothetical protein
MAAKRFAALACLASFWFFLCAQNAFAEKEANPTAADDAQEAPVGYSFTIDAKGNAVYMQELSWDVDPYALEFIVTVRDAEGKDIISKVTTENSLSISLQPGTYAYNIATKNLLGQIETETGYQPLTILRAEMPGIDGTSPAFIFMDSLNGKVTLRGARILADGKVYLQNKLGFRSAGKEESRVGEEEVTVSFPESAYVPGTFDLVIVNPGGLSAKATSALRIMYQRPVDILASAGYEPAVILGDSWFSETWSDQISFPGANASLSVYFTKKAWGFLGFEATTAVHRFTGGAAMARLTSDYLLAGGNLLYKYRVNKILHLMARTGGGIAASHHSFDYSGRAGPNGDFSSPFFDAGIGAQIFLPQHMYLELGTDWNAIFSRSNIAQIVVPVLKVGYQIF